ncbi:hypothetical protein RRG08_055560 [Elysia crispata]|uniref:Uncharacterized protein n=1 Tax=Elysia crispata TaxID=231223 RepID=A0AAE1DX95_9GAST|nr:hypothetical protein RRG08_055560 [Elysia crispata]
MPALLNACPSSHPNGSGSVSPTRAHQISEKLRILRTVTNLDCSSDLEFGTRQGEHSVSETALEQAVKPLGPVVDQCPDMSRAEAVAGSDSYLPPRQVSPLLRRQTLLIGA